MPKKRMLSQDLVRAVCCLGMVAYHFSMHLLETASLIPIKYHANGLWGEIFVTVFFAMSGAMLYRNHPIITGEELKKYYYKRWKSIFPAFYTVFLVGFFINVVHFHRFFYYGNPLRLLYSVLGIDGYLSVYGVPTYYICGEWFLGAIIILYLLYPVILYFFNKNDIVLTVMVFLYFMFKTVTGIGVRHMWVDVFSCLLSFEIGMFLMKHELFVRPYVGMIALIIAVITLIVPLPGNNYAWNHLTGIAAYLAINMIGKELIKVPAICFAAQKISSISYPVYLVHHLIIIKIVSLFYPLSVRKVLFCLLLTWLASIVAGYLLSIVNRYEIRYIDAGIKHWRRKREININEKITN